MTRWLTIAVLAALTVSAGLAHAESHSPTLDRIAKSGVFKIGYVPDAPPMSFLDKDGKPVGYSLDLCRHVASAVRKALKREDISIEYVPLILPAERIAAVVNGDVDIECGATTVTLSRRQQVDFSLFTFITGGTVLSTKAKPIPTLEHLPGKRIAVIQGTTTEDALRRFGELNEYGFTLALIRDARRRHEIAGRGQSGRLRI